MGSQCPNCYCFTFHKTLFGRECSKCGYKMILPESAVKPGEICANCGGRTVNKVCTKCGATFE